MTATLTRHQVDVGKVLERADRKWASRRADDPADADYLTALASAVQQQVVDQIDPGTPAAAVAPGADEAELQQLRFDNQRLTQSVVDLQALADGHDKTIGRLRPELQQARTENQRLTESVAELQRRDTAATETIERLMVAEGEARMAAATWESEYERVRDERLAEMVEQAEEHRHAYEWRAPNTEPAPCGCGQPWPRGQRKVVEAKAPEPDPWGELFDRVRGELSGWPA